MGDLKGAMFIEMKYGVIDIGTNTVHGVVYSVSGKIKTDCDITLESEILTDTKSKKLSAEGIEKLILNLKKAVVFFAKEDIDSLFCFATSAMRDIENFNELKREVRKKCDIDIELLGEYEEALCDFYALSGEVGENCNGIGVDLGGGSCQIFRFDSDKLIDKISLIIGVKRLYLKFGDYKDTKSEDINNYLYERIKCFKKYKCDNLYIMGGTAKTIHKILKSINGSGDTVYGTDDLKILSKLNYKDSKFADIIGNRVNTIEYGISVIKILCSYFNIKKIFFLKCGVREGYIIRNITNSKDNRK